jgi:uncharacterized protein YecE (DUF72 family)
VPEEFVFTVKAWQAITHPTSSATWKKRKEKLSETQVREFGGLNPHEVVLEAWEETCPVARTLRAPVILLQTPSRFGPSEENIANLRGFLSRAHRHGMELAGRLHSLNERYKTVYCMFNNYEMYPNASRLRELL